MFPHGRRRPGSIHKIYCLRFYYTAGGLDKQRQARGAQPLCRCERDEIHGKLILLATRRGRPVHAPAQTPCARLRCPRSPSHPPPRAARKPSSSTSVLRTESPSSSSLSSLPPAKFCSSEKPITAPPSESATEIRVPGSESLYMLESWSCGKRDVLSSKDLKRGSTGLSVASCFARLLT